MARMTTPRKPFRSYVTVFEHEERKWAERSRGRLS
ncbi:hypothetical protein ACVWWJ_003802 [Luteibacter sp. HA06]|jgi:hypothetical protein